MRTLFQRILVLFSWMTFLDSSNGAKFIVTVPKSPHYDTEYTAVVSASGIYEPEYVTLEYRPGKDGSRILNRTQLKFEYDGVQSWGVVFPWQRMQDIDETAVVLKMTSEKNGAQEEIQVYFDSSTGYIFVQTDKPVYTPRQKVKFRILAVDEYQRLAKYPLKVDIMNDKKIIVDRLRYSAEEAFKGQEFELPKETDPGNWSITASYEGLEDTFVTKETVNFEVKEYVLSRFYAEVSVDKEVIVHDDKWVSITVTAKYVYGRPVIGSMEMQLGLWDDKTGLELLPARYSKEQLIKGKVVKNLRTADIFPNGYPKNKRLYINVNVTEKGTLENDTVVDTSTFISHPYYDIEFEESKVTFKPGFPYTLQIQVKAKSGTPASWVHLYVTAKYKDLYNRKIRSKTESTSLDQYGKMKIPFEIPANAYTVEFHVAVFDMIHIARKTYTVNKFTSPSAQYMHISMKKEIHKFRDGEVLLRYTQPQDSYYGFDTIVDSITVMVIAKGQVVHSAKTVRSFDGRSIVTLPKHLSSEVNPSMRIVAFYHTKGETIIDSLLVDTPDVCVEELAIKARGGMLSLPKKPKESFVLDIIGGRSMKVGMVAVDKAVFLINNAITLSRQSMFKQLNGHDQGEGIGDGYDADSIFKHSGLQHKILDSAKIINEEGPLGGILIQPQKWDREPYIPSKNLLDHTRRIGSGGVYVPEVRPQTVRKHFPESWLFEEFTLSKDGRLTLNRTLPDSITTWSLMAVGISANRGVCVSLPMEQKVEQTFFADIRMPYKVTRLEEVKIRIAIYNFKVQDVAITGWVSGSDGLCFPSEDMKANQLNGTFFKLTIPKKDARTVEVKLIPLRNGELTVRADLSVVNTRIRDVVERKLFVVAEGQRIKKSFTFVLDPEAKHATYKNARRNKIVLDKSRTVHNSFDLRKKEQKTKVQLALPKEIIFGTEACSITAFGDLMGDIITHAVVKSKSLMDQPVLDAEEVLGDLGPTVHALIYANNTKLMDDQLSKRGQNFVKHAVMRLLKYRKGDAFSLTQNTEQATWLTAFVLKTLCHSSKVAYVHKEQLIDKGFAWLLAQVNENGTLKEQDWRLADDSMQYRIMLSAEVLTTLVECGLTDKEHRITLEAEMITYLEDSLPEVTLPLVLAKVAYALTLYEPDGETTREAVKRLLAMKERTVQSQNYWSSEKETKEPKKTPFWYRLGAKASSIEATAYALMVFLEHGGTNVDAIADWLVGQRNANGAFIGAMDSSAAIQALSAYSLEKRGKWVDLKCDVSSDRHKNYHHFFRFTEANATDVETFNNVPVGQILEVSTKGQGLGQMAVNLEYNIPIDKNAKCPFNITIDVKPTEFHWTKDMNSNPMCSQCDFGCVETSNDTDKNETTVSPTPTMDVIMTGNVGRSPYSDPFRRRPTPRRRTSRRSMRSSRRNQRKNNQHRHTRAVWQNPQASKKSICFKLCIQHLEDEDSGPVTVEVEMLTGHVPVTDDLKRMKDAPGIRGVEFVIDTATVLVHMSKVPSNSAICIGFRAVDDMEVSRPQPASVVVKQVGTPYPACIKKYDPVNNQQSLQVYCADQAHYNKGECRCYSGYCGTCVPSPYAKEGISLLETKNLVCSAPIAYQLRITEARSSNQWLSIDAEVISINKTGGFHKIEPGQTIKLMTPASCQCIILNHKKENFYLLSSEAAKLLDRYGSSRYRYLLDHNTRVLNVNKAGEKAIRWDFLHSALVYNTC